MESQRRLRAYEGVWLAAILTTLVLVACDADEPETAPEMGGMGEVAQGFDPFCATRPKIEFCEDFDTDELPGAFSEQTLDSSTMVIDGGTRGPIMDDAAVTEPANSSS